MGKIKHGRTSSELTMTYGGESSGIVLSTLFPPGTAPEMGFQIQLCAGCEASSKRCTLSGYPFFMCKIVCLASLPGWVR